MIWSYSRVKSFTDCPYRWYLRYILNKEPEALFFSSYGSFVHKLLDGYYSKEISGSGLLPLYLTGFRKSVKLPAPTAQVFNRYFQDGVRYFTSFEPLPFLVSETEKRIDTSIDGISFTGWIDFLGEDSYGDVIIDHKSRVLKQRSARKKPTKSDEELDEYFRQLYLYGAALKEICGKSPDRIGFNCFRNEDPVIMEPYNPEKEDEARRWFSETIETIGREKEFRPRMEYFKCNHLCDMKNYCEFFSMTWR